MLTLNDGRSELWQWDTGRKLTIDADCSQIHFSNKVFGRSIDVDVVDGVAIIPDILLQIDKDLTAWAFVGTPENGYTKISKVFKVNKRNKPADYVFTPPEQTTLQELVERLDAIEESQDPDAIKNAVEDYLEQNPVEAPVQSVNGKTGGVKLTAEDVGAISQDKLQEATSEALAQAKASGEFDGLDGKSAYQIAVDNGFEGSEAEWLESLKGGGGGTSVSDAVLYTEQDLSEEQQAQARENIGAASESEVSNIKTGLDCFTKVIGVLSPVDFETIKDHVITNSGKITTTGSGNKCSISSHIPVVPGETVYITASEIYANAFYAFYKGDGTVVSIDQDPTNSGDASEIVDKAVVVPGTAETLVISFVGTTIGAVKRIKPTGGLTLQPWKGRIWTAVGDSLTEKNSRTDLNYHDYIAEDTGITVINQGYSGSGYAQTGSGAAFHLRIDNVNPNSDVVTIFGSFNDYSAGIELGTSSDTGTETICGCINTTIDNLIAVMPAVSLGIVTPTPWQSGNPADPNNAQTKYADALVEICKNRSIPCLDLYRCSNLRPWTEEGRLACYSKDGGSGTHPDETGHKLIAARFKAFLESLIM